MIKRRSLLLAPLALLVPVPLAFAARKAATEAPAEATDERALKAAADFLKLVDADDYAGAWQATNGLFEKLSGYSEKKFTSMLRSHRANYGPKMERALETAEMLDRRPLSYTLQYKTRYREKEQPGYEVLTVLQQRDQNFYVSGYVPYTRMMR